MSQGKRVLDFTQAPPETVKKSRTRKLLNYLFVCRVDEVPTGKYIWNISVPSWACCAEKGEAIAWNMNCRVLQQGKVEWQASTGGKPPYIQATVFTPMGYDTLRSAFLESADEHVRLAETKELDKLIRPVLHLRGTDTTSYEISGDTKHLLAYFPMFGGDPQDDRTVLFSGEARTDLAYIKANTIKLADTFGYGVTFDLPEEESAPLAASSSVA